MLANILSIGYERRSVDELVAILKSHGVGKLIDVREIPQSRKRGFSKTGLAATLADAGIAYVHIRSAGNPHHKEKVNTAVCLGKYAGYLASNPAVLDDVVREFGSQPTAVLCYERLHNSCHRSILLEAVKASGHQLRVTTVE